MHNGSPEGPPEDKAEQLSLESLEQVPSHISQVLSLLSSHDLLLPRNTPRIRATRRPAQHSRSTVRHDSRRGNRRRRSYRSSDAQHEAQGRLGWGVEKVPVRRALCWKGQDEGVYAEDGDEEEEETGTGGET